MADRRLKSVEVVVPEAMTPLENLSDDKLARRVAHIGKNCLRDVTADSRYLAKFCDNLDETNLWQRLAPTWEEFCKKILAHPASYVDLIRDGVRLLDRGDGTPIPERKARKAAMAEMAKRVPTLEKNGTNQHGGGYRLPTPSDVGRSSEYLIARIKRDRPDIADRILKGEFESVNEAAREAGISVRPTVKLGDPQSVALSILRLQGQQYAESLIEALKQAVGNAE